ncbi:hypothetical protein TGARI_202975 [Toxoplasma gondii ARI]|uniref:Uncharacterized protein n=1 Tax=Toxoplasma gondii ARI TaxID=1074872 RepID=A0A139XZI2_TOXGO|nr:hypothetical protein TGARI_202975 [Toxoplasma gondii ARI]
MKGPVSTSRFRADFVPCGGLLLPRPALRGIACICTVTLFPACACLLLCYWQHRISSLVLVSSAAFQHREDPLYPRRLFGRRDDSDDGENEWPSDTGHNRHRWPEGTELWGPPPSPLYAPSGGSDDEEEVLIVRGRPSAPHMSSAGGVAAGGFARGSSSRRARSRIPSHSFWGDEDRRHTHFMGGSATRTGEGDSRGIHGPCVHDVLGMGGAADRRGDFKQRASGMNGEFDPGIADAQTFQQRLFQQQQQMLPPWNPEDGTKNTPGTIIPLSVVPQPHPQDLGHPIPQPIFLVPAQYASIRHLDPQPGLGSGIKVLLSIPPIILLAFAAAFTVRAIQIVTAQNMSTAEDRDEGEYSHRERDGRGQLKHNQLQEEDGGPGGLLAALWGRRGKTKRRRMIRRRNDRRRRRRRAMRTLPAPHLRTVGSTRFHREVENKTDQANIPTPAAVERP